jgi:metal iron transporter
MVSEGMLNWTVRPWLRRLLTRSISIIPSVIIAAAIGRSGLNDALTASQVVLSVILPFVTAPLIYFTCRSHVMTVIARPTDGDASDAETEMGSSGVNMRNGWIVTVFAVLIWLVLVVMNVSLLVLVGLGKA